MIITTVLVRLPVDMDCDEPQEAAARTLRDIIEHGIGALRLSWHVELDESNGIITLR